MATMKTEKAKNEGDGGRLLRVCVRTFNVCVYMWCVLKVVEA